MCHLSRNNQGWSQFTGPHYDIWLKILQNLCLWFIYHYNQSDIIVSPKFYPDWLSNAIMNFKSSRLMRNIFRITIQRLRLSISKAKYHNHMLNAIIKGEMLYFCQLDELGRVKISDPGQRLDLSNLSDPLPIKNLSRYMRSGELSQSKSTLPKCASRRVTL